MLLHKSQLLDPPGAGVPRGCLTPVVVQGVDLGPQEEHCMIFTTELPQTPQQCFYTLYSQLRT